MKKIARVLLIMPLLLIGIFCYCYFAKEKPSFYEIKIEIEETKTNKVVVHNEKEFIKALENSEIHSIEITSDLDLGCESMKKQGIESKYITCHKSPLTHPILKETGISNLWIENKDSIMLYSLNGSSLLHVNIRLKNSKNIKIKNIKMKELWEWDEETFGNYSRNDWDYITIVNSQNVILENIEFSKSYDGIVDIDNSKNVIIKHCKVKEEDMNSSYFQMQFQELEENMEKYPMYQFLRKEANLSIEKIKEISSFQYKLFLIGPKDYGKRNENIMILECEFNHVKTRIPLARNSEVYLYKVYFDAHKINPNLLTKEERDKIKRKYPKMTSLDAYGPISIQNSYVLVEESVFLGVKYPYSVFRGFSLKNLGRIDFKGQIDSATLKKELDKVCGTIGG